MLRRIAFCLLLVAPLLLATCNDFDTTNDSDESLSVASVVTLSEGIFSFRVKDDSMSPLAEAGDIAIAEHELPFVSGATHVVTYRLDGSAERVSTLRLVSRTETGYVLSTVNSSYPEVEVGVDELIGLVPVSGYVCVREASADQQA